MAKKVSDTERLKHLIATMFSSEHDAEAENALRAARRLMAKLGLNRHWISERLFSEDRHSGPSPTPQSAAGWPSNAAYVLSMVEELRLQHHEVEFLTDILMRFRENDNYELSIKQQKWLHALTLRAQGAAAASRFRPQP